MSRSLVDVALILLILSAPPLVAQSGGVAEDAVRSDTSEIADSPSEPTLNLDLGRMLARQDQVEGVVKGPRISFGLGSLSFFDHLSSLSNTFSQSTVILRDPAAGGLSTTVLDNDPKLNNAKLDFGLDLRGVGAYAAVELPSSPRLGDAALIFEVAWTGLTFDVVDTTVSPPSTSSLEGDGLMVGAGFDVRSGLGGQWSAAWGYRYRNLSNIDVARSASLGPPFVVLDDGVSLSWESHELGSRFSYASGPRYRPYAGVLFRRTEVEIDDRLRFVDGLERETDQRTLSWFDSDVVLGIAGVEAQLSSLAARLESFFGDGDYGVRFQVGWSFQRGDSVSEPGDDVLSSRQRRKRLKRRVRRAKKLTPLLAEAFARIERDFIERRRVLDENRQPPRRSRYRLAEVLELLEATQRDLEKLLRKQKLHALDAYFRQLFSDAVAELKSKSTVARADSGAVRGEPEYVLAALSGQPTSIRNASTEIVFVAEPEATLVLDRVNGGIESARIKSENDEIYIDLCIHSVPDNATVTICPMFACEKVDWDQDETNNRLSDIERGLYSYHVVRDGYQKIDCFPDSEAECAPLDLMRDAKPMIQCDLVESTATESNKRCRVREEPGASPCRDGD